MTTSLAAMNVILFAEGAASISLVILATTWLAGVVWVAGDARARTDDAAAQWVGIACAAVLYVAGVILYVAARPRRTLAEEYERRWELEALAREVAASPPCPRCGRCMELDFILCPYCRESLGATCGGCNRFNRSAWVACPYCGRSRASMPVQAERERAPAERVGTGRVAAIGIGEGQAAGS
jgi:hypothetical protein